MFTVAAPLQVTEIRQDAGAPLRHIRVVQQPCEAGMVPVVPQPVSWVGAFLSHHSPTPPWPHGSSRSGMAQRCGCCLARHWI